MENKSSQNVCLASCITSVDVHHTDTVSVTQRHRSLRSQRKSVTFFQVFWWQTNLNENFSFRFCKSSIYSLIFWFFAQMQKDLNEKQSCKYSRPFWILSRTSKSSSFPGLLDHKIYRHHENRSIAFDRAVVKQEKNMHKTFKIHLPTPEQYLHQVNIMLLQLDLRMPLYFFRKLLGKSK